MLSSIICLNIQTLNQSPQIIHRERRTVGWHNCCAHYGGPLDPGRLSAWEEWRQVQPHGLQAFQHTTQIQHEQAVVVMTTMSWWSRVFSPKWMVIFLYLTPLHHQEMLDGEVFLHYLDFMWFCLDSLHLILCLWCYLTPHKVAIPLIIDNWTYVHRLSQRKKRLHSIVATWNRHLRLIMGYGSNGFPKILQL